MREDAPGFVRTFRLLIHRRAVALQVAALCCALLMAWLAATLAQGTRGGAAFPVGIKQLDYVDPHERGRHLALTAFYPAEGYHQAYYEKNGHTPYCHTVPVRTLEDLGLIPARS